MEMITATSQILVALAVAFIAWKQYRLASRQSRLDRERLKHELLDRRLEYINDTQRSIEKPWNFDVLSSFTAHIEKARLLFPSSSVACLVDMRGAAERHCEQFVRLGTNATESVEERHQRIGESLIQELNRYYRQFLGSAETLIKIEDYDA